MSFLETVKFQQKEERVKRYLLPQKILLTKGKVTAVQKLLKEKDMQIDLYEPSVTVLKNSANPKEKAAVLLDFGFEFHGGLRVLTSRIKGAKSAGATLPDAMVRLSFGESVSEALSELGEKGACNDHSPRVFTVPVSTLSDLEFGQTGYRFVLVQLETLNCELQLKSLLGSFIYRELDYKGSFSCSDERLNRIYDVAAYTCHLNMQNLLWDGIKRDRLVWVGDTHPEMLTICTLFGRNKLLEDSLRFARNHAPLPMFMNSMPSYSLWWLLILHDYYMATGNQKFLNENKKYALVLAKQMAGFIHEDGTHDLLDYFLDWPTRYTPAAKAGVHGLLVLTMKACAELAEWCGDECSESFRSLAKAMASHCPDCGGAKQAVAMQSLAGIRDKVSTAKELTADGAKGMSTFMSYYILKAMSEENMTETLNVLREYYGAMLDLGATTFWEDFNMDWLENAAPIDAVVPEGKKDIHGDCGAFCYEGFRHSLCHGWASGPVPFLAERVLGISIADVGCKTIRLKPDLGDLSWAKGTFPTPKGVLSVSYEKNADGTLNVTCEAPKGIQIILEQQGG